MQLRTACSMAVDFDFRNPLYWNSPSTELCMRLPLPITKLYITLMPDRADKTPPSSPILVRHLKQHHFIDDQQAITRNLVCKDLLCKSDVGFSFINLGLQNCAVLFLP